MSIIQAMFAGSSALTNFGEAMTVIGNNLANANTTAFKASSSSFEDVLIQTVGDQGNGASTQIGTGVGLADVRQNMAQGSFEATANVTDLSIDGKGFFMVKNVSPDTKAKLDESGKPLDTFYTRAGGFKRDQKGDLVTNGLMVLQGWELDIDGNQIAGGLRNINFSQAVNVDPTPTSLAKVGANLDANTPAKDASVLYSPTDPSTYDFSTSLRVFDPKGKGHNVEIQFRKMPKEIPATITGQKSGSQINFSLKEKADVTLTFTPVKGGAPIVTTPLSLAAGNQTVDVSKLKFVDAAATLGKDVRYRISYSTTADKPATAGVPATASVPATAATPAVRALTKMVGDDSVSEIMGEDNANIWDWHAVVPSSELDLSQQGPSSLTALDLDSSNVKVAPGNAGYTSGKLVFDNLGKLRSEGSTPIKFQFAGADPQEILFDFGDAKDGHGDATNDFSKKATLDLKYADGTLEADTNNTGSNGSLQVASGFATLRLEQNGFPSGFLDKLAVDKKGVIIGNYTNGQSKQLFQVSLVDFDDEEALEQVGSNLFVETVASGLPRVGEPQSGRLGNLVSYSLEQSNVDMSSEFVRMITTQRGFQANSRIVTVTDGMLEELLALKR